MKNSIGTIFLLAFTLCTSPAWARCSFVSIAPCHEVKKPSPIERKVRGLAAKHRAHETRIAGLERRLKLIEEVARAQQHQLLTLRQQLRLEK